MTKLMSSVEISDHAEGTPRTPGLQESGSRVQTTTLPAVRMAAEERRGPR